MLKFVLILVGISLIANVNIEARTIQNVTELTQLKQSVLELSLQLQSLNESLEKDKHDHVMFYAVIKGKGLTLNIDTILVFETVIVNEGGQYDPYDGVFVAPHKGVYLFSWTVTGSGTNYIVSELVVEENVISSAGELNSKGGYPSGSMTALCKMEKCDHAWVRTTGVSASHYLYSHDNYPQSSFLGMLIKND